MSVVVASGATAKIAGIDTGVAALDAFLTPSRGHPAVLLPKSPHTVLTTDAGDGRSWTTVAYQGQDGTACSVAALDPSTTEYPIAGAACARAIVLNVNFRRIGVRTEIARAPSGEGVDTAALYGFTLADVKEIVVSAGDHRISARLSAPFLNVPSDRALQGSLVDPSDADLLDSVKVKAFLVAVPSGLVDRVSLVVRRSNGTVLEGHP